MAAITEPRPGTKAKVRYVRMSASKVRVVLNLIRGKRVTEAIEILEFSERLAAQAVLKCLKSAVANAEHNEEIGEEELFVSVCFADQGPTLRRFRPRARGRAGRIQKQTCHITVEVSRLTAEELDEIRQRGELSEAGKAKSKKSSTRSPGGDRAARVAKSKAADADAADATEAEDTDTEPDDTKADDTKADEAEDAVEESTESTEAVEAAEEPTDETEDVATAEDADDSDEAEASDGADESEDTDSEDAAGEKE